MRKIIKIGFPIVCVGVILGTFYLLNKLEKKVEGSIQKSAKNEAIMDEKIQNATNSLNDKVNGNNENKTENNVEVNYFTPILDDNEVEKEKNDKEQKAIEITKKKFGDSDTVYYTNEGIEEREIYYCCKK